MNGGVADQIRVISGSKAVPGIIMAIEISGLVKIRGRDKCRGKIKYRGIIEGMNIEQMNQAGVNG